MLQAKLSNLRTNSSKWFSSVKDKFNGRSSQLLFLYDYIAGKSITEQHFAGKQTVSLSQICGTVSAPRLRDFDSNFRLINKNGQKRLDGVEKAWGRKSLPPVSLFFGGI